MGKGVYVEAYRGRWRVRAGKWDPVSKKTKFANVQVFDSEIEARRYARDFEVEVRAARDPNRRTVATVAREMLADRPRYAWSLFKTHLEHDAISDKSIDEVDQVDVIKFRQRLEKKRVTRYVLDKEAGPPVKKKVELERRLSAGTVTNAYTLLRSVLRYAYERKWVKQVATDDLRKKRSKRTEVFGIALRPAQIERFLREAPLPERHLFAFAIFTGLRVGELVSLHARDIVFDDAHPHIWVRYGGLPKRNEFGQLAWPPTKGGKPRKVPLLPGAMAAYEAWLRDAPAYLAEDGRKNALGLAFPRKRGGVRSPLHLLPHAQWVSLKKKAGVEALRIHDFRHTCATSLLRGWWGREWTIEEVQMFLGHGERSTTEHYLHADEKALEDAASEMRQMAAYSAMVERTSEERMMHESYPHGARVFPEFSAPLPRGRAKSLKSFAPPGRVELPANGLGNRWTTEGFQTLRHASSAEIFPHSFRAFPVALECARAYLELASSGRETGTLPALMALATAARLAAELGEAEGHAAVGDEAGAVLSDLENGEALRAHTRGVELATRLLAAQTPGASSAKVAG